MPEERTVSTFTWLTPALRSRLSVSAMTAMTQIRQYYKTEEKVCTFILDVYPTHHGITQSRLHARSKPSVKFFDIKNRFFSKSGAATNENPDDDEDDSWLDEPNVKVFPPEGSLDVSPNIDLSSQCLAASLSEEPSSRDTPNPQPNPRPQLEEAHGEPSELDNDFSMDL